ncbi:MAG: enoyl-CoA hydratase-related protein, partial [Pseudomonadota bacterium]
MIFEGKALSLKSLDGGIVEMCFDLADERVNKFNQATLNELGEAISTLQRTDDVKGLLLTSAKKSFFVGADVTEFGALFQSPENELVDALINIDSIFSSIEDLPVPTVVAINGEALGGGLEICLTCDYRVMAADAKIGLPEVKLGILPGWGGTVRLPRMIGIDNAIEWIATGANKRAPA